MLQLEKAGSKVSGVTENLEQLSCGGRLGAVGGFSLKNTMVCLGSDTDLCNAL